MSKANYWNALRHRQLSRRDMLRASGRAGVGAAGLALVGCGDDDDDDVVAQVAEQAEEQTQAQTEQAAEQQAEQAAEQADTDTNQSRPAREEAAEEEEEEEEEEAPPAFAEYDLDASVIAAYGSIPGHLDQGHAAARGGQAASNSYHYGAFLSLQDNGAAAPGGLAEWELTSDHVLVHLTEGRVFHNGDPVTTEDLKFTVDRLTNKAEYNLDYVSAWTGELDWVDEVSIPEDGTLKLTQGELATVNAASTLAGGGFPLFSKAYIEEFGDAGQEQHPISTGPFKFDSWTPDEKIVSVRNDRYHNGRNYHYSPRLPYIQRMEARLVPEIGARLAALEAGEIDLAMAIPADLAVPLGETGDYNVFYHPAQRGLHIKLPMTLPEDPENPGAPNPWQDRRVRIAANLAVDVDAITQNILTGRENYTYSISSGQFGFPEDLKEKRWGYDPEEAKRLLAEAGYEDYEFSMVYLSGLYTNDQLFMEAIAEMLRKVGFKVNLDPQDISTMLANARTKDVPQPFLFPQPAGFTTLGSFAVGTYSGATYEHDPIDLSPDRVESDRLIDEARSEFDEETRRTLLEDAVRLHYMEASWIFLFELVQTHVATSRLVWEPFAKQPASVELWNLKALA